MDRRKRISSPLRLVIAGIVVGSVAVTMRPTSSALNETGARALAVEPDFGPLARSLGDGRWRRGNTHTHTLWSDGDAAPEMVARWYREHGYQFLVLSDHNVLSVLTKFFPIEEKGRLTPERVAEIAQTFGEDWVETRDGADGPQMRLKTLLELSEHFEQEDEFVFVQGEEITDAFGDFPVHVNAMNLEATIRPAKGPDVVTVLRNNLLAVQEQARESGRPILAHLNHPNFRYGVSADDIAQVVEDRFFEVYNGHPGVNNHGNAEHPSTEEIWDLALTARLEQYGGGVLYGVATDDAHHYFEENLERSNTGAGWVMVQSEALTPDDLVKTMQRGDFYASSGVFLSSIEHDADSYRVSVRAEPGVEYRIEFVGTRTEREDREVGEVLQATVGAEAEYAFFGDELYVRVRIRSDRVHPRPSVAGDVEMAWCQPVVLPAGRAAGEPTRHREN